MTGIVKAVTMKLEPEDPFKILVVDYKTGLSSKAPLWSKRQALKYYSDTVRQNLCYFLVIISVNP